MVISMLVRRLSSAVAVVFIGFAALNAGGSAATQYSIPASSLSAFAQDPQAPKRTPDVIYVPTPQEVVDAMLKLANVTKDDVVYDLGCGDGRIVVTAARTYGARGVGIDIDPQRIREARENVEKAGVGDLVKIIEGDLFTTPLGEATVVTLYLLPSLNQKLIPKLNAELKKGTRVVSHSFAMGDDWPPEQQIEVDGHQVYFWTIPKKHHLP
jgi:precorrin-6B methylase 2